MLKHVSVIPLYKKVHIKSLKIESKNKRGDYADYRNMINSKPALKV